VPFCSIFGIYHPPRYYKQLYIHEANVNCKVTLHSHGVGSRYYNLGRLGLLFLHPSLRNIHLSCAEIGDDLDFLRAYSRSTPLASLVLEECGVTAAGLSHILSAPRALQHLTIGESAHHSHGSKSGPIGEQPIQLFAALALQKHSLRFLKHTFHDSIEGNDEGNGRPIRFADTPGLFHFEALTHIEISTNSFFKSALEAHLGPRDLKSIRLLFSGSILDNPETAIDTYALIWYKHLQNLDLVHSATAENLRASGIWNNGHSEAMYKFARHLKSRNINLQLYFEVLGTCFPPYLYGETVPRPSLAFSSEWYNFGSSLEDGDKKDGEMSKDDVDRLVTRMEEVIQEAEDRVNNDRNSFIFVTEE
jgi:hypothetical protein